VQLLTFPSALVGLPNDQQLADFVDLVISEHIDLHL
jgi:hypothetical protein